jgi:hypothetical protein
MGANENSQKLSIPDPLPIFQSSILPVFLLFFQYSTIPMIQPLLITS